MLCEEENDSNSEKEKTKSTEKKAVKKKTNLSIIDISEFEKNRKENCLIESPIPVQCKESPCVLGIDEAGRGPVLGPMVYAAAYTPLKCHENLREIGVNDSKQLTEDRREELYEYFEKELKDSLGWLIHILSPYFITTSMLGRIKYNLNEISHDTAIGLIRRSLDAGVRLSEVYVDTVGKPEPYKEKLSREFPHLKICVESKADVAFPVVGAASICAKVTRDVAVARWNAAFKSADKNIDSAEGIVNIMGSGYPGDPVTKQFLRDVHHPVFGFPHVVRSSWATAASISEEKGYPVSWPDDSDDENGLEGQSKKGSRKRKRKNDASSSSASNDEKNENSHAITDFFSRSHKAPICTPAPGESHRFFKENGISSVHNFF